MTTETSTDTPAPTAASTARETTWVKLVDQALAMESRADSFGLLHLVSLTKGKSGVVVDVDELAARLDVNPGTARTLLARLEESVWVERRAELVDRKPVLRYVTTTAVR